MKKQSYAVFGLGRYGQAVARELVKNGADVMAVDKNENIVNDLIDEIPYCKCADVTNEDVIKQLGISNVDVVIIAIATNLEASIMATVLCKEAGVKNIIVKCANEMNRKILKKIGADQVVFPESESGMRLAKKVLNFGFIDIVELSDNVSMVEIDVRPEWNDKNLIELNIRRKYSLNVIAYIKNDKIITNIDPEMPLSENMKLIVIANKEKLKKLK